MSTFLMSSMEMITCQKYAFVRAPKNWSKNTCPTWRGSAFEPSSSARLSVDPNELGGIVTTWKCTRAARSHCGKYTVRFGGFYHCALVDHTQELNHVKICDTCSGISRNQKKLLKTHSGMAQNPCTMEPFVESRWQHIMFDPSTGYGPASWSKILSHTGGVLEASHHMSYKKNDLDLIQSSNDGWWIP